MKGKQRKNILFAIFIKDGGFPASEGIVFPPMNMFV
jgi:hypothetical protein